MTRIIRAEERWIITCQRPHELIVEIVELLPNGFAEPLFESLAAAVDIKFHSSVKVLIFAAFRDLRLVIELDLRNQKFRESPRILVYSLLSFAELGDVEPCHSGWSGRGVNCAAVERLRRATSMVSGAPGGDGSSNFFLASN